jgi:uncharacterized spore protein YtfJ
MKESFDEVLGKVTDFLKNETKSETVIGQPFELGEFKCVPVIRVGMGFGFGGGEGEGEAPNKGHGKGGGSGTGAGMGVEPMGFLVTRGDQISFIPTRMSKGLAAAFEKVPDLLEKYFEKKEKETAQAN